MSNLDRYLTSGAFLGKSKRSVYDPFATSPRLASSLLYCLFQLCSDHSLTDLYDLFVVCLMCSLSCASTEGGKRSVVVGTALAVVFSAHHQFLPFHRYICIALQCSVQLSIS